MSNQLLPCPFCGHDEPTHDEGDESAWVQCTNGECGMCGPMASGPSLAAAAWNRRATHPAAGESVATLMRKRSIGGPSVGVVRFDASRLPEGALVDVYLAPPAAAHEDEAVRWVPCSERLPEVAQFDQQGFIVSVQRKDKVLTMSALYLNAYPLYCEDHDDADDEGYVQHTGWYDAKSNGDDANCYTLVNDSWYGSTVTHWMPMPKPAAAMRAQAGEGGEV